MKDPASAAQNQLPEDDQQEDIKKLVYKYLMYWHWFAIGLVVMLIIAFLYNRYSTSIYNTTAEIKILKDKDRGMDLTGLEGAGSMFNLKEVNLENEIEILNSRKLWDSVVTSLHLNSLYFKEGRLTTSEIWRNQVPFKVNWSKIDSSAQKDIPLFYLDFKSDSKFKLTVRQTDSTLQGRYNQPLNLAGYTFTLTPNPNYVPSEDETKQDYRYAFQHLPQNKTIDRFSNKLTVQQVGKESEILSMAYEGANKIKSKAIINSLIKKFNIDGMRDKQLISKRTEEFVTERLKSLFAELDTVETGLVNYKEAHDLVTIESTAKQLFGKESEAEQKRFEKQTQLELARAFKQELLKGSDYSLLPANLGIESSSVNDLTAKYNEAAMKRNDRLTSSTSINPVIEQLEKKLDRLKGNILQSVNGYINDLSLALESIKNREQSSSGKLHQIPQKEKGVRRIMRQQEVKEKLYLFLLQKREEAALQYATTEPTIKVIDYAYTNPDPIAPKKKIIYLAAMILGVLIPFGILYLRFLFDTKINNKEDITDALPNIPVLTEIPAIKKGNHRLIRHNDRSTLAEAFRILRTNLNFFRIKTLKTAETEGKVIFVTSTTKGEGKTFLALNTAFSIASTGKRVLIIGADLRNPQTHSYFGLNKNQTGVSSYLSDPSLNLSDLTIKNVSDFERLDLLISGHIPPNPAELMMSERFENLIEEAKTDYDFVIVDTAPTILVTDTLLISNLADTTLYAVRANYTEKRAFDHINEIYHDQKLKNMALVLNAVSHKSRYGYSYNYGYGYGYSEHVSQAWWKFWKQ